MPGQAVRSREASVANKQEFNKDKFDQLVLYICSKVENPADLGAVKLHKILWFSDLANFARCGRSIAGDNYIKMPQGPFSTHAEKAVKRLERAALLAERQMPVYNCTQRQFFATGKADLSAFSADEISIVDDMISAIVRNHTASSISEFSHTRIWEIARDREAIPLSTVFAINLANIDEETLGWAADAIDDSDLREAEAAMG